MNRLTSLALLGAPLLALASSAYAQGITLTLSNDTSRDLRITVYDMSLHPPQPAIAAQVLNGFASITIPVTVDESGQGHIRWTASTVDHDMPRCSQRDKPNLADGATVHLFASGTCPGNP